MILILREHCRRIDFFSSQYSPQHHQASARRPLCRTYGPNTLILRNCLDCRYDGNRGTLCCPKTSVRYGAAKFHRSNIRCDSHTLPTTASPTNRATRRYGNRSEYSQSQWGLGWPEPALEDGRTPPRNQWCPYTCGAACVCACTRPSNEPIDEPSKSPIR